MVHLDIYETLFVGTAFLFQVILIIHFAIRKWRFQTAMRYGPIVYALSLPTLAPSLLLMLSGKPWSLWLGGFLYFFGPCSAMSLNINWIFNGEALSVGRFWAVDLLISGDDHVLLIPFGKHPKAPVLRVCSPVCDHHHFESIFSPGFGSAASITR